MTDNNKSSIAFLFNASEPSFIARLYQTRISPYGIQYHAIISVKGLNEIKKNVVTAWLVENGKDARLVTAYIANDKKNPKT